MPDRMEERFRWAVEASPSGMILVDGEGIIVFMNSKAESLFGYAREELIGQRIEELIPPRHRSIHSGDRDRYARNPASRPMGIGQDFAALRRDGSEFPAEIGLTPIREGGTLLTLASVIDITGRKKAEEAMRRNQEDLERILYVVSHDLREPLRSILGFATLLLEDHAHVLDETGKDYLNRVVRASNRMRTLLGDLLELSRARAMGDHREPVDGGALVKEVLDLLSEEIERTGARITVAESFPPMVLEPTWARHALRNLVENALKFRREGESPDIEITAYAGEKRDGLLVGFVVSDRGPGIPPDRLGPIFELFQRGADHNVPGTGAGLAIAREVAERSGGRCTARNREAGGAEFTLAFGQQGPAT